MRFYFVEKDGIQLMASFSCDLNGGGHNHPNPNQTRPTQKEVDIVRGQLVKDPALTPNMLAFSKLSVCFVLSIQGLSKFPGSLLDSASVPLALLNPALSDRVVMKNLTKKVKKEMFGDLGIKSIPEFEERLNVFDNTQNREANCSVQAPQTTEELGKKVGTLF